MNIGIEAQRIFRPHKHGMDVVAVELIKALQKIDTKNQYFIFVKKDEDNGCIEETKNFKIIETPQVIILFGSKLNYQICKKISN